MLPIYKIKRALLDILFPQICLSCKEILQSQFTKEILICTKCLNDIHFIQKSFVIDDHISLIALGSYKSNALRSLIHNFKYQKLTQAIVPIEKLIDDFLNTSVGATLYEYDVIVPIPLHRKRESERGFNQAKLIAEIMSSKMNIPLVDCMKRVIDTPHQTNLKDYSKRMKNVSGAFEVRDNSLIENLDILLVDDVYTSGATAKEVANGLLKYGVNDVGIFVMAKTK